MDDTPATASRADAVHVEVVAIAGSLREGSSSLAAAAIALEAARAAGARTRLLDVRDLDLPMYRSDADQNHEGVQRLVAAARAAHGMIWSSPLYHGTISGAFKNALDWLQLMSADQPPYLTDKVIGLISTAGGTQGLQGVNTMEFIVRALRGWAVPLVLPIPQAYGAFAADGRALDAHVDSSLRALGGEIVRAARGFMRTQMTTAEALAAEE